MNKPKPIKPRDDVPVPDKSLRHLELDVDSPARPTLISQNQTQLIKFQTKSILEGVGFDCVHGLNALRKRLGCDDHGLDPGMAVRFSVGFECMGQ